MIPWFLIHKLTVDSQQSGPQGDSRVGPDADQRGMYWGWPQSQLRDLECKPHCSYTIQINRSYYSYTQWKPKDQLFDKEVRKYQWRSSVMNAAKKLLMKVLTFTLYLFLLWLVILARNQLIWVIFLSISALTLFVYFVFYKTRKFSSNLR